MSSENNPKNDKDSTTNLMRLFKVQPDHQLVTRQDLTRDYNSGTSARSLNSDDEDENDDNDDDNNNFISINNYYTWNSSITNASIHKERAAIMSALHSAESVPIPSLSAPSSSSRPLASKSFTKSHRVQDIVAMCSDERSAFSTEDYHNESGHSDDWPQATGAGGSNLWTSASHHSSSATSTAYSSSDGDDEAGRRDVTNHNAAQATNHRQTPRPASAAPPRPLSIWHWTFGLFRKK
ncbi:uncharacterized protein LOC112689662 [Sipha flava]|uniref:Uncharacterized protein LOC112689662 n=1 Tax=Sipha flava TaxID=143950 RepID=A0A2S2QTK3_9HEMI|nr:uncharacterized protein LOC112689662 [Sipha flava]